MSEALANMAVETAIEKMVTPFGKHIEIFHVKNTALYAIKFKEGGDLPDSPPHVLKSAKWTSPDEAKKSIAAYLRDLWAQVEESRAKTEKRKASVDNG